MSIRAVAYGTEDMGENWFVQTCCGEHHDGCECDCKSYGETLTEEEAKELATELSDKYNVDIEKW